jgi:putative flippase GtrA
MVRNPASENYAGALVSWTAKAHAPDGATPRICGARRRAAGRAAKFAVVGGIGAIINMAALVVLYRWVRLPLPVASVIAAEVAVVHNYQLNNWWTFAARTSSFKRFAKFNVSMLGGLAANVLVVWALVGVSTPLLLANGTGIAAGFAANFAMSVGWVWRRRER